MSERERILHRWGAIQHALVTRRQLASSGLTKGQVDHLVRTGRLGVVYDGVYRIAGAPITWDQQMLAARLASRGTASQRAAVWLWGVDLGPRPPIELITGPTGSPRLRGAIVHRSANLPAGDVSRKRGIAVTNPLRTLVDLGAVVGHDEVEHAVDSLTSRRIVTVAGIRAYRDRLSSQGQRGVGVLGDVLDSRALGDQRADGMLEPVMAGLCRKHGVPMPSFQVWVLVDGKWRRMDFAYIDVRLNIEVDGYEEHGAKFDNWLDDKVRDAELTALGWHVLRFSWDDVRYRPAYVARIITTVLAQRRALLGLV